MVVWVCLIVFLSRWLARSLGIGLWLASPIAASAVIAVSLGFVHLMYARDRARHRRRSAEEDPTDEDPNGGETQGEDHG
jgi:hypothetical protein